MIMLDNQLTVSYTGYHRMPSYVTQISTTIRVYRNQPGRVELQIRHPKHYMNASLTPAEAREVAALLRAAADDVDGGWS